MERIYAGWVAKKLFPIRVDDETKARWEAAARDAGYSLAEYIREAVNERAATDAGPVKPKAKARRTKQIGFGLPPKTQTGAATKTRSTARTAMCEHRRPPETFCPKCGS